MILTTENLSNWIRVSVFYAESAYRQLIGDFLKPYVLEQRQAGNIKELFLSFSKDQGDHIRLAFECPAENRDQFADDFHDRLEDYLAKNPSESTEEEYIRNGFFMNFPDNSIQYNLFRSSFTDDAGALQLLLSERILNVFAEEDFDDSSMLSFVLYVIMTFCNQWEEVYGDEVNTKISDLLGAGPEAEQGNIFAIYASLFNENKEMIVEMYEEVLQSNETHDISMKLWPLKQFYKDILSKTWVSSFNQTVCFPFDKTVLTQLNMGTDSLPPVYYLVQLCMESLSGQEKIPS